MNKHWLSDIISLLSAETSNLRDLAALVGQNPDTFYRGVDLSRTDLSGQNLLGMDFTGANLRGAIMDDRTRIDPAFDPIDYKRNIARNIRLPRSIRAPIEEYMSSVRYSYTGAAIKNIIWYAKRSSNTDPHSNTLDLILNNKSMMRAISDPSGDSQRINLPIGDVLFINRLERMLASRTKAYRCAIILGLIRLSAIDRYAIRNMEDIQFRKL